MVQARRCFEGVMLGSARSSAVSSAFEFSERPAIQRYLASWHASELTRYVRREKTPLFTIFEIGEGEPKVYAVE